MWNYGDAMTLLEEDMHCWHFSGMSNRVCCSLSDKSAAALLQRGYNALLLALHSGLWHRW